MKKEHYRDYAIAAFRLYARLGSCEKYKQKLWNEAIERQQQSLENSTCGISQPTEAAAIRAEKRLEEAVATLEDLRAVEFTFDALYEFDHGGGERVNAVELVYMLEPKRPIRRGEIEERVLMTCQTLNADRRTIYRWLADARYAFALERGLRID